MGSEAEDCASGCYSCRDIVLRAYQNFRDCGGDDRSAFRVALRVLNLRHPERASDENAALASEWIGTVLEGTAQERLN